MNLSLLALALITKIALGSQPLEDDAKKLKYAVAQVNAEFQILPEAEAKALPKKLAAEFAAAKKEYQAAKKAAKKAKQQFDAPAPVKPKVKVLPKRYSSSSEAEAAVAKLKERAEKKTKKDKDREDGRKKKSEGNES